MAGRGPMPKDPSKRARTNKPRGSSLRPPAAPQPEVSAGGEAARWWVALGEDPRAAGLNALDWLSAQDTVEVLSRFYEGQTQLAGEVRIRKESLERRLREVAELGVPGDVGAGDGAAAPAAAARARRGPLTAV